PSAAPSPQPRHLPPQRLRQRSAQPGEVRDREGGPGTPPTALTAVSAALPIADFARLRGPLTEALRREVAGLG
ncbi:hypothetical protein, partial [Streptomyces sp. WAC 06725]|uniref:hypothetical protein n=1 Tax=Streptomyces sp. WAC 06725 TaxID=2203209 RepID=UPI00163BB905